MVRMVAKITNQLDFLGSAYGDFAKIWALLKN